MDSADNLRQAALEKHRKGLVQVYTGNGKGKTTAAFGQALRAVGQGYRVCVIQFMKGRAYGECIAARNWIPNLTVHLAGLDSFVMRENPAPVDIALAREGLALARRAVLSGDFDMVILDEINVAADFRLVPLDDILELIRSRPARIDLVLTGRYAPPEIIAVADTVSDIREVRHHYQAGAKERPGIEF